MRVGGQRAALAGLEIHDVVADGAALERQRRLAAFLEHGEVDAEGAVRRLGSGDRLEHEIDRRAAVDQLDRSRHMRQHAGLRRDLEARDDARRSVAEDRRGRQAVGRRIEPITASPLPYISPSMIEAATPARLSVGWLGCKRTAIVPGQADRVAEACHDAAFARREDQILIAHQLADRRRHLRRDAGRQRADDLAASPRPTAGNREIRRPSDARSARKPRDHGVSMMRRVTSSLS